MKRPRALNSDYLESKAPFLYQMEPVGFHFSVKEQPIEAEILRASKIIYMGYTIYGIHIYLGYCVICVCYIYVKYRV